MTATLANLPDLRSRAELNQTFSLRLSTGDRQQLERAAQELGVAPGRLVRALVRKALAETAPVGGVA